jgi:hypothetical protein
MTVTGMDMPADVNSRFDPTDLLGELVAAHRNPRAARIDEVRALVD